MPVFRGQINCFATTDTTGIREYIVYDNVVCGLLHPDAVATVKHYQVFNDDVVTGIFHIDSMIPVVRDHIIHDDDVISVHHVNSI